MQSTFPLLTNSNIIAITAAFISLLAFATTVWQGCMTRKHNRLSVRPILDFEQLFRPGENIKVILRNSGIGVAIINSIHFENNGHREYFSQETISALARRYPISIPDHLHGVTDPETPLPAGHEILLLEFLDTDKEGKDRDNVIRLLRDTRIHVKYACIYGSKSGATAIFTA